jgi:hypothetical protein
VDLAARQAVEAKALADAAASRAALDGRGLSLAYNVDLFLSLISADNLFTTTKRPR